MTSWYGRPVVPASTSIRRLIEQALEEAREEFALIVKRKLEALMGEAEPVRARATPARAPSGSKGKPAGRRSRTPESHMAELRSRVLSAMPNGEPLKRARIIELARLSKDDAPRVASVLK